MSETDDLLDTLDQTVNDLESDVIDLGDQIEAIPLPGHSNVTAGVIVVLFLAFVLVSALLVWGTSDGVPGRDAFPLETLPAQIGGTNVPSGLQCQEDETIFWIGVDILGCVHSDSVAKDQVTADHCYINKETVTGYLETGHGDRHQYAIRGDDRIIRLYNTDVVTRSPARGFPSTPAISIMSLTSLETAAHVTVTDHWSLRDLETGASPP